MSGSDLDAILRIEERSFDSPWSREQFLATVGSEGQQVDVVLEFPGTDGMHRIAGYASAWVVAGEMQINNIAVAERDRRRGYGSRILDHLLQQAVRLGCVEVSLEVSRANRGAIRLYEGRGFRKAGIREGYYPDSGEDALILTWFPGKTF